VYAMKRPHLSGLDNTLLSVQGHWYCVGGQCVASVSWVCRRDFSMGATFCDVFNSKRRHVALKNVHDT
jgi:hypothetical protein